MLLPYILIWLELSNVLFFLVCRLNISCRTNSQWLTCLWKEIFCFSQILSKCFVILIIKIKSVCLKSMAKVVLKAICNGWKCDGCISSHFTFIIFHILNKSGCKFTSSAWGTRCNFHTRGLRRTQASHSISRARVLYLSSGFWREESFLQRSVQTEQQ